MVALYKQGVVQFVADTFPEDTDTVSPAGLFVRATTSAILTSEVALSINPLPLPVAVAVILAIWGQYLLGLCWHVLKQ